MIFSKRKNRCLPAMTNEQFALLRPPEYGILWARVYGCFVSDGRQILLLADQGGRFPMATTEEIHGRIAL